MGMTKEDIIKGRLSCHCDEMYKSREMVDPNCVLHEYGDEIELMMSEYSKNIAIAYNKWYKETEYKNLVMGGFPYYSDEELFDLFLKQHKE